MGLLRVKEPYHVLDLHFGSPRAATGRAQIEARACLTYCNWESKNELVLLFREGSMRLRTVIETCQRLLRKPRKAGAPGGPNFAPPSCLKRTCVSGTQKDEVIQEVASSSSFTLECGLTYERPTAGNNEEAPDNNREAHIRSLMA